MSTKNRRPSSLILKNIPKAQILGLNARLSASPGDKDNGVDFPFTQENQPNGADAVF